MRLRTALQASQRLGDPLLFWWDSAARTWQHEIDIGKVGRPAPNAHRVSSMGLFTRGKRAAFPSTLFESGRRPAKAFSLASLPSDATVILHTSYLAHLIGPLRAAGVRRVAVDVHDLVTRAHVDDARFGHPLARPLRATYAASVGCRELRRLAHADSLAVAGWSDAEALARRGMTSATWTPSGISATPSSMPTASTIRVGLIGNFEHSATLAAASLLLDSPLGQSKACELVFAGLHSTRSMAGAKARMLGAVEDVRTFYDEIHAVVVPVRNGSGMKCKLAEGSLAGKAVITTPQGAAGYPPTLSSHFAVAELAQLTPEFAQEAIRRHDPDRSRRAFEAVCGEQAAAGIYAEVLEALSRR